MQPNLMLSTYRKIYQFHLYAWNLLKKFLIHCKHIIRKESNGSNNKRNRQERRKYYFITKQFVTSKICNYIFDSPTSQQVTFYKLLGALFLTSHEISLASASGFSKNNVIILTIFGKTLNPFTAQRGPDRKSELKETLVR